MPDIQFIKGNLFDFATSGVVAHVCNDIGLFGAGFAAAVARRYPSVRDAYINEHRLNGFRLGDTQFVPAGNLTFANMIAQKGVRSFKNPHPIKYNSVEYCLLEVYHFAQDVVHMPKIGSGLAGGNWAVIEEIIRKVSTKPTFIYEL